ncbi:nickel/cobalt transporter [Oharaeibacter diazotrophicus]|uniref:Nickel/cobalt efflux system n=2 Tax=Oharaeibacter diazotrophicus TaxID=1920512 RepID=A0A4R6RGI6_9HYPH|nr:nickel/cobalt transporter [Oharaeibacter diazotrophicus]TDP84907.1 ABC-type nickel/cobalt efflux system permease component RcnA [Oharaeibacter diazotrophicus]BBE73878.1 high-affinity nickel-transport protein [Pleomorphomonas sp. SM30]GLS76437.1 nickel/cobalt efflux system [Oharaeibacter diazotrophicus]
MPLSRRSLPLLLVAALAAAALLHPLAALAGTGPFGVGLPEPAPTGGGFLPGLFRAIAVWQSTFYKELTGALRTMKTDGSAGVWLCAVSFLYGVLHAAGPGHGKAVVSAYVLANRETARNGAILAMVSALAQGFAAVALVSVAALVLGATSIAMTKAAEVFEIGSFALIAALGLILVWRKILRPLARAWSTRYAPTTVFAGLAASAAPLAAGPRAAESERTGSSVFRSVLADAPARGSGRGLVAPDGYVHHAGCDHDGSDGIVCDCGHVHGVSPAAAAGRLDWHKAWTAVLAVGLRPCTGALIVLVFALAQGLYPAGIAATFAMAVGTGLTVAALTLAAVGARGAALRLAGGDGVLARRVHAAAEAVGAVVVLAFGSLMLAAALAG